MWEFVAVALGVRVPHPQGGAPTGDRRGPIEGLEARRERDIADIALVRVEQLYPLDIETLIAFLSTLPLGRPVIWVQEEPQNMGALSYIRLRFEKSIAARWPFYYVGRAESSSPATGSDDAKGARFVWSPLLLINSVTTESIICEHAIRMIAAMMFPLDAKSRAMTQEIMYPMISMIASG